MPLRDRLWRLVWRLGFRPPEFPHFFSVKSFVTWHSRPRFPDERHLNSSPISPTDIGQDIGIVVQGPVRKKNSFTLRTLAFYRTVFPNALIVLSTWQGELQEEDRSRLNDIGVALVELEPPESPGPGNLNLQIVSTVEGIKCLRALGAQFILKSRSDQRIYAPDALRSLVRMQHLLPGSDGKGRLFAISVDTFSSRVFGLSDMLQFGTTDAVNSFWDVGLVADSAPSRWEEAGMVVESYLAYRYAQTRGDYTFDFPGWREALQEIFGVVDASSLDFIWPKYSQREYLWRRYDRSEHLELGFLSWMALLDRANSEI